MARKISKRQRIRKTITLCSFLLFPVTIYYFSPYLIVLGAFQGVLVGSALTFGLLLCAAMVLGRSFCAWLCPAGGLQDLTSTIHGAPAKTQHLRRIKYLIWVPWIAAIIIGALVAGGIKVVDPLFHTQYGLSVTSTLGLCIYLGIVALFFVLNLTLGRRGGCHAVCWMSPFMVLGEKLGCLLRLPQLKVSAEPEKCVGCGKCTQRCPMSLDVENLLQANHIAHSDCIRCAECVDCCPKQVLKLRFMRTNQESLK